MSVLIWILELTLRGLSFALVMIGFALMVPFAVAGMWLEERADDLKGGWRRGRQQNALWCWSRRWRRPT